MNILLFKTLHIVGFTAWFAGLFYLVRIFVYHIEAFDQEEVKRSILIEQYRIMEGRVYRIICMPAMIITWICGLAMIFSYGKEWFAASTWIHIKLVLLLMLTAYHLFNGRLVSRLAKGKISWTSYHLRLWNEVPTLFLVSIAMLAVFKNSTDLGKAVASLVAFAVVLVMITKAYKRLREKKT